MKALDGLPTWTRVSDLIAEHPGLSAALGGTPSHWACYRFARKLRAERGTLSTTPTRVTPSLLDAVFARGLHPRTVAMDPGYDHAQVYAECEAGDLRRRHPDPQGPTRAQAARSTR